MTLTCCRRNIANIAHSRIVCATQDSSTQRIRRHPGSHAGRSELRATHSPAETEATPWAHPSHCFHNPLPRAAPWLPSSTVHPYGPRPPSQRRRLQLSRARSAVGATSATEQPPSVVFSGHEPQTVPCPPSGALRSEPAPTPSEGPRPGRYCARLGRAARAAAMAVKARTASGPGPGPRQAQAEGS